MKSLLLLRHAKSSWKYPLDDEFRPLNSRGYRDAPLMAKGLAADCPDLVLCSPAVRTYSTALFCLRNGNIGLDRLWLDWNLYEASGDMLLRYLLQLDDKYRHVWLFGHNPGLNELLVILGCSAADNMPTGARVALNWKTEQWNRIGKQKPQVGEMVRPLKPDRVDRDPD